jgi:hypothetical protein
MFGWTKAVGENGMDEILMLGGSIWDQSSPNRRRASKKVWHTSDGIAWSERNNDAPWGQRRGLQACTFGRKRIVVVGGYKISGGMQEDVWKSLDAGLTWSRMIEHAPFGGRIKFGLLSDGLSRVLLVGGQAPNNVGWCSSDCAYEDVWLSDNRGQAWTEQTASLGGRPRTDHQMAFLGASILVLGGHDGTGGCKWNDVWRTDDWGLTWNEITGSPDGCNDGFSQGGNGRKQHAVVHLGPMMSGRAYMKLEVLTIGGTGGGRKK